MTTSTTSGTHRRVWRLAGPIILSNVSVPLLGAVDTALMGHLPDPAYLGAVAVGALVFSYVYWGFGFLRMGTTGLAAQAAGADDAHEVRAVLARGLMLAGAIGAAVIALQVPIAWLAFTLIKASAQVEDLAARYVAIRIWGAPAALAVYVAIGWLLGMQRAAATLAIAVAMNALNIALSVLFVQDFGWGIEGVALGTLAAEWSAAAFALVLVGRRLAALGGAWQWARIRDRARILRMIRVNADIFVRTLCLLTGFAWFTATSATFGDVVLAANAVLLNFQTFMAYALDGFAHAAEALVGTAIGARDRAALRAAVRTSSWWALGTALAFAAVYFALGERIVALLTSIDSVRAEAARFLPWTIASPLISVWSFQLDGIFIGATRTAEMRNGMIIALAAFLAAVWLIVPELGNHGLWLALMLFMVARAATLGWWYPRVARGMTDAAEAAPLAQS